MNMSRSALLLLFLVSPIAHAYLDPGAISLGLQALFAAVAAAALFWRFWFWKAMALFGIRKAKERSQELSELRSQQDSDDD